MKLYIDTTNAEKITVGLDDETFTTESKEKKSQKLLPFIDQLLSEHNKNLDDISEIEINTGPGSYTGIRVGLAVALTLGRSLGIPVNGLDVNKGEVPEIEYG